MTAPVAPLPEGETLPCPFCGEQPEITKHFKEDAWRLVHRCDVMGALVLDWTEPRRRHVDTWNTRTAERRGRESAAAEVERLKDLCATPSAELHGLLRERDAAQARIAALETTLAERDRQIAHEIYDKGKIQRRHDFQANRASSAEARVAVLEAALREMRVAQEDGDEMRVVEIIDEALAAPAAPREEGT